jgi:phosphoribosylanthranilate isomerase
LGRKIIHTLAFFVKRIGSRGVYTRNIRLKIAAMPLRVKICCIASVAEAELAVEHGAAALGLVGAMPSGPGVITDAEIRRITASIPPPIATFLLTSETTGAAIAAHHRRVHTTTVQLVDTVAPPAYAVLRQTLPGVKLVQVIHVRDEASIPVALAAAEYADALLLDSGNPDLPTKELGGTGRVHDWQLSRQIVAQSKVPVFLAGGLRPDNIRRAIDTVAPFGVDLCSGIRTDGHLDPRKLAAFFEAVDS